MKTSTEDKRFEERKLIVSRELTMLINGADKRGRLKVLEAIRGFGNDLIAQGSNAVAVKLLALCDELAREADRLEG